MSCLYNSQHFEAEPGRAEPVRALYATRGSFSHINTQLFAALQKVLPEVEFEKFDTAQALSDGYGPYARCLFGMQQEYGFSTWTSREKMRYRLARSRAYYVHVQSLIRKRFAGQTFAFTFQTQSLFNAAFPGVPNFVYTDHVALAGGQDRRDAVGNPSAAWLKCERAIYADAKHVFTFGPSVRSLLTTEYGIPKDKASAIGAGASVVPARPVDTTVERYARRKIVFVGVDWERKGGPELIAAFKLLKTRIPDVTLTIIGCSPNIKEAGVEILGRLPLKEVEEHYHAASCFCMPSRLEPFGIVFVEAMQFGLPVVATDVGDISAIVAQNKTGRLATAGNVQELADALFDTLDNAEHCRALGIAALDRATQFTWEAVARRIAAHLPRTVTAKPVELEPAW